MPSKRLKEYLIKHNIDYLSLEHPPAFTAQEAAGAAHVSGKSLTKTVIVKVDGRMVMAVVHAARRIDLSQMRKALGARRVELATEEEFGDAFSDCELGAMPPFGNLYGMEVFVEPDVPCKNSFLCNAGRHDEVLAVAYEDFKSLVRPITIQMTA